MWWFSMSCWSTSLTLRAEAQLSPGVLNTPELAGVKQIFVEVAISGQKSMLTDGGKTGVFIPDMEDCTV